MAEECTKSAIHSLKESISEAKKTLNMKALNQSYYFLALAQAKLSEIIAIQGEEEGDFDDLKQFIDRANQERDEASEMYLKVQKYLNQPETTLNELEVDVNSLV